MNERVKKLWIDALRGGEFEQGHAQLMKGRRGVSARFCCLGVLCEIARTQGVIRSYVHTDGFLPLKVMKWAGLHDINPDADALTLTYLNDHGKDFNYIADQIEKYL